MRIAELHPQPNWVLTIVAEDGRSGAFDVSPYLEFEAFEDLRDPTEFIKVHNGGYFIEWECGADLSADTIEVRWQVVGKAAAQAKPDLDSREPNRITALLRHEEPPSSR